MSGVYRCCYGVRKLCLLEKGCWWNEKGEDEGGNEREDMRSDSNLAVLSSMKGIKRRQM